VITKFIVSSAEVGDGQQAIFIIIIRRRMAEMTVILRGSTTSNEGEAYGL